MKINDTKSTLRATRSRFLTVAALAIILAVAACLRFQHISDPIGGYHAMNEAWYISVASNFSHTSLLRPTGYNGEEDTKIRALYPYAAYASFKLFGESPATARAVSAAAGMISVLLAFLIALMLKSNSAGLAAAAFLALSPIHVTLSRNAQPESLFIAFSLLSVLLYLRSEDNDRGFAAIALSGLFWGAAVFTKNSALLILPCIFVNEIVIFHSARRIALRLASFIAPATALVAPFIIWRLFNDPARAVSIYKQIVIAAPGDGVLRYILSEAFWAVSPATFVAAVASIPILLFANSKKFLFPCSLAAIFCFQYLFQNVHSYYFLPAAVFLTIAAALGMASLPQRIFLAATGCLITVSLFGVLTTLPATKIGFSYFSDAARIINTESHTGTIIASEQVFNNYGPVLAYYLPGYTLKIKEKLPIDAADGKLLTGSRKPIFLLDFPSPGEQFSPQYQTIALHKLKGLRLGRTIHYMSPVSPHSFIPKRFGAVPVRDNAFRLGYDSFAEIPALVISRIPPGASIYLRRDPSGKAGFIIQ